METKVQLNNEAQLSPHFVLGLSLGSARLGKESA